MAVHGLVVRVEGFIRVNLLILKVSRQGVLIVVYVKVLWDVAILVIPIKDIVRCKFLWSKQP
jgi:cytochrome c oxidase subunit IV